MMSVMYSAEFRSFHDISFVVPLVSMSVFNHENLRCVHFNSQHFLATHLKAAKMEKH